MSIPTVKRWRVKSESVKYPGRVVYVLAPTAALAKIVARSEYPDLYGRALYAHVCKQREGA